MLTFRQFIKESNLLPLAPSSVDVFSLSDFLKQNPVHESIEEAGEFGMGAPLKTMTDDEMQTYLQRVFNKDTSNLSPESKKDKFINPRVHRSLLQKVGGTTSGGKVFLLAPGSDVAIDTDKGEVIDVEDLKAQIKERPKNLLSQNEKMAKSGGQGKRYMNFGFPALLGLAVDERTNQFVVIKTCPGAGACQMYCYAMSGNYIQYKDVNRMQMRVLNFMLNDPKGFFARMKNDILAAKATAAKKNETLVIRWHDSGDFFSSEYTTMFYDMVKQLPDVEFYAYTKMANVANDKHPDNLTMNFSQGAKPEQVKQVDLNKTKHSVVVPKNIFADLVDVNKDPNAVGKYVVTPENDKILRQRLADTYKVPVSSVISYKDMMKTPENPNIKQKWNVYILPKTDGDVSAARRDVHGTFLLIH